MDGASKRRVHIPRRLGIVRRKKLFSQVFRMLRLDLRLRSGPEELFDTFVPEVLTHRV
jgi:hypothetical protein